MIHSEIERRLTAWAREYGERDRGNGWQNRNLLSTLIEHHGFVPESRGYIPVATRTEGDEVEEVVQTMGRIGMIKPATVIRVEYFMARWTEEDRIKELAMSGFPMGRTRYFDLLAQAKAYVSGALIHRKKTA